MNAIVAVYAAGLTIALWRTDAGWLPRIVLALLWPLGLVSAVIATTILLAAAAVLFPWLGAVLLLGGALAAWLIL